ncbi:uncharacterized protein [Triticum aestivum]|uniref:uncharacterized protein n=1 Tax=Triticum aestivum TaxID=4565 RepID=UPI001D007E5A|nr:uncharacterized protein LOC123154288 [Triticum aestivum]
MSSAAYTAAAAAATAVAPAAATAAPAPVSPFLASRPLATVWQAQSPGSVSSGSPIRSEGMGDLPPSIGGSTNYVVPSSYGGAAYAAPSMYGPPAAPIHPSGYAASPMYRPPAASLQGVLPPQAAPVMTHGVAPLQDVLPQPAPAASYGAAPPPSSTWRAPSYGTVQPQPYTAPAQPMSYGAASTTPHGGPAAPHYGAHTAAPPGAYPSLKYDGVVPASHPSIHVDPAVASSPFYFSHLLPVKLSRDKYLSWRAQVLPLLRSRYLEGYVDGSLPCPPPYHPAYHTWVAQDQAILSAIQSSLTPSVSSLVIFTATSRDAWAALHTSFASQSQARAHSIRTELGETKLRDLSITDYFNKMTGFADTLASIGQPLLPEDFTTHVLNGLDDDYDNLVESVHGRDAPLQPRELYARLLGREQRIKARRASPSFASANTATRRKPQKPFSPGGKQASSPQ